MPMGGGDAEGEDLENQEVADAPCKAFGVGKIETHILLFPNCCLNFVGFCFGRVQRAQLKNQFPS